MGVATIALLVLFGFISALLFFPIGLIFVNLFGIPMRTITTMIAVTIITTVFIYALNNRSKKKLKEVKTVVN